MKPTLAEQKRAELEIITAMENSVEHMKNGKTDLRHYNESVFRFLFIEQLFQNDSIEIWDEWRRIDLLLRFKYSANGEEHSLFIPIEFK
ncbi:MAG TPA: hypothetical protein VLM37_03450, partial [Fibrobacteraceae bacterium]|nr:hypothetical protein [Fibrobacteraceae bacterium]